MQPQDRVVVVEGITQNRRGTITGTLARAVDGCTLWVQLDGIPNPIGYCQHELLPEHEVAASLVNIGYNEMEELHEQNTDQA